MTTLPLDDLRARASLPHLWEVSTQFRDVETTDSLSMLSGRAVPYDQVADIGYFLESFTQGSLGKSVRESAAALPLMLFHGQDGYSFPAGSAVSWDERSDGLYGVWRIADDPEAQRAARLARDGHLNFLSIRFAPIEGRTNIVMPEDLPDDLRHHDKYWFQRREARLLETSMTPTPAYNGATVTGVRNAREVDPERRPALDHWRDELAKLRGDR